MKKYTVNVKEIKIVEYTVDAKDRFDAYLKVKNTPSKCRVTGGGERGSVVDDEDIEEVIPE